SEQREERLMIRALSSAQRNLETAVEEVKSAGSMLARVVDEVYGEVGPTELVRLQEVGAASAELKEVEALRVHAEQILERQEARATELRSEIEYADRRRAEAEALLTALQHDTALP